MQQLKDCNLKFQKMEDTHHTFLVALKRESRHPRRIPNGNNKKIKIKRVFKAVTTYSRRKQR